MVDDTHDSESGCPEGLKAENLRLLDELETARFGETWVHPDHWAAADRVLARRR